MGTAPRRASTDRSARPAPPSRDYPEQQTGTTSPNVGYGAAGEEVPNHSVSGEGVAKQDDRAQADPAAILDVPTQHREKQHNPMEKAFPREKVAELAKAINLDFGETEFALDDLWRGMNAQAGAGADSALKAVHGALKALVADPKAYAIKATKAAGANSAGRVDEKMARLVAEALDANLEKLSVEDLRRGMGVELESAPSGNDGRGWTARDLMAAGKAALAHLGEREDYYRAKKFEDVPQASAPGEREVAQKGTITSASAGPASTLNRAQAGAGDEDRPGNVRQAARGPQGGDMPEASDHRYAADRAWSDSQSSEALEANSSSFPTAPMGNAAAARAGVDPGPETPVRLTFKFMDVARDPAAEEQTVLGIVLQPDEADAQKDIYGREVVRHAAENFLANYGLTGVSKSTVTVGAGERGLGSDRTSDEGVEKTNLGFMHKDMNPPISLLQSYVAPCDLIIAGVRVVEGTWVMKVRINSKKLWEGVKTGKYTGFSIGGVAKVRRLDGKVQ